jgi:hypothetical protein
MARDEWAESSIDKVGDGEGSNPTDSGCTGFVRRALSACDVESALFVRARGLDMLYKSLNRDSGQWLRTVRRRRKVCRGRSSSWPTRIEAKTISKVG